MNEPRGRKKGISPWKLRVLVETHRADSPQPGENLPQRPRTRGDCDQVSRPCVHVSCEMNNYLAVSEASGALYIGAYSEPNEMPAGESCAMDVADRGEKTLDQIGKILHLTRERIRQIESRALKKMHYAELLTVARVEQEDGT